ncbi:hypothetical protein MNBD_ALPHA12-845 [hydrothermal vent metagenome]|uniref:Uncharacterized protein n=1 Tax=hydrothermal vent metagenome TaxID=652676 RepID=A0A3B0TF54_9ZZZZ
MLKILRFGLGFMVGAALMTPMIAAAQPETPPVPQPRIERPSSTATDAALANPGTENASGTIKGTADTPTANAADGNILDAGTKPGQGVGPIASPPQPISLSAKIVENSPTIREGLVWRVFATKTDESGQLPMLFKSEDATASLSLPAGEYVVHVAYGRSQASDTLKVVAGPNFKTVILDSGALRLRGAVSSDISIPADQLSFDIYTSGLDEERVPVALDVPENTMIHLNAGTYNVVSRWGKTNASVRADLRVEPGQLTDATLFHRAAQISFKLVSKAGGEAIADVEWSVKDSSRKTIFSKLGAFPVVILSQGDYEVIAKVGNDVYNRAFQVQPGAPREIEVLTTVY